MLQICALRWLKIGCIFQRQVLQCFPKCCLVHHASMKFPKEIKYRFIISLFPVTMATMWHSNCGESEVEVIGIDGIFVKWSCSSNLKNYAQCTSLFRHWLQDKDYWTSRKKDKAANMVCMFDCLSGYPDAFILYCDIIHGNSQTGNHPVPQYRHTVEILTNPNT